MKYIQHYKLLLLLTILLIGSCKKFVTIPEPTNRLVQSNVFTTDQSATAAIVGIYSNIVNNPSFTSMPTVAMALSADELTNTADIVYNEFYLNNIQPSNNNNLSVWSAAYQHIYQANSIIEGLQTSQGVTDSTKNRVMGEAKFIRAFCYYYLVNLWGAIPLILETNYNINSSKPRTDTATIYQQILKDLTDSKNALSSSYTSADRIRPNKWTVSALLSRVYLSLKDYSNAETEASAVINSGMYSLSLLANTFLISSTETIWQMPPKVFAYSFIPIALMPANATSIPSYPLSPPLFNSFEMGDARKTNWLKSTTIGAVTYNYPYKYKVNSGTTASEYLIVFRLAEIYLNRAEAKANANDIVGSLADLNIIRKRATLKDTTTTSQSTLLALVEHERQVELFTEWGDRWISLKRTGRTDAVLPTIKGSNWQSTDRLWPIPQTQIDANPNLNQNGGY
jgi:starch-binding outer membrane protein, SusD/RagB family